MWIAWPLSQRWGRAKFACLLVAAFVVMSRAISAQVNPEALLTQAGSQLSNSPESAKPALEALASIEPTLTPAQRGRYFKLLISSYAFRGMYKEQVEASEKALKEAIEPNSRAIFLYYLTDGYASLGEYEKALLSVNENLLLLPKLSDLEAEMDVLQSAVSLMNSLGAYDDSTSFAKRLAALPAGDNTVAACLGKGDLVEIAFLRHESTKAREILPEALQICDAGGHFVISRSIQALDAVDRLNSSSDQKDLINGVGLFENFSKIKDRSDYAVQLADAIARRYLKIGQASKAELYENNASQWVNSGNAISLKRQVNETMAAIMRAQGRMEQAVVHFDASRNLWAQLMEERSKKDIAYQRIKFQTQDQTNQLQLLSQINKLLVSERELQERNKHVLEMLVAVSAVLLSVVSVWLMRTWRQKNDFRTYSQIDGLTKISNRSHFIACAHGVFADARGSVSVILFDMDEFKLINDTYSHAAGDWVLKTVSATIASCLRSHDLFGRIGGEEFAICLPHTSEQEASSLADRCRVAIEGIDSSPSGHQFSLSASFGIAIRPPNGVAAFEEVLAAADRALYQAKHLGRNRIVPYGEVSGHAPLVP